MNDLVCQFLRADAFGKQVEIMDALPDIHTHLVGEDHARKRNRQSLSPSRFHQEVVIPTEEDSSERSCAVEQFGVRHSACIRLAP